VLAVAGVTVRTAAQKYFLKLFCCCFFKSKTDLVTQQSILNLNHLNFLLLRYCQKNTKFVARGGVSPVQVQEIINGFRLCLLLDRNINGIRVSVIIFTLCEVIYGVLNCCKNLQRSDFCHILRQLTERYWSMLRYERQCCESGILVISVMSRVVDCPLFLWLWL